MARTSNSKNALTVIQQDEERFAKVCEAIDLASPQKLINTGTIGRTFIFKYKRREGVRPEAEARLLQAIKTVAGKMPKGSIQLADEAINAYQKSK